MTLIGFYSSSEFSIGTLRVLRNSCKSSQRHHFPTTMIQEDNVWVLEVKYQEFCRAGGSDHLSFCDGRRFVFRRKYLEVTLQNFWNATIFSSTRETGPVSPWMAQSLEPTLPGWNLTVVVISFSCVHVADSPKTFWQFQYKPLRWMKLGFERQQSWTLASGEWGALLLQFWGFRGRRLRRREH